MLYDLDGKMPAWLAGIFAHLAIEADLAAKYSNYYDVRTNVFIPGGGADRTKNR